MQLYFASSLSNTPTTPNQPVTGSRPVIKDSISFGNATPNNVVETFYSTIPESLARFHRQSTAILAELGIEASSLTQDHIYIATSSAKDYMRCKQLLTGQNQGKELKEHPNFNGRRVSVWKLGKPWNFRDTQGQEQSVGYVEMGEPKPGQSEPNRVAHIAYQVKEKVSERPVIAALLGGTPITVDTPERSYTLESARVDSYGGLKIKTQINQEPFEIELRQDSISDTL